MSYKNELETFYAMRAMYGVWNAMLARCSNPNVKSYEYYGGRGIKVCERWQSFECFYKDMGLPAGHGLMLERKNNDGDYTPENCVWATRAIQVGNKSNSRLLTANGRTQTMAEWARDLGCNPSAILYRLNAGWSVKRAVTEPKPERPNSKLTMRQARAIRAAYPGKTMPQLAAQYGVSKKTVLNVLHHRIFKE